MADFYKLPPMPRELRDFFRGLSSASEMWVDRLRNLLNNGAFPWSTINFTGSALADIETRPHSALQNVLGGADQHHVQQTERAELIAIDALGTGMVAKTADATYAARTITGTANKVDVANGSGVSANPTLTLPAVISGPQKFGTDANNSEFEADGTLKFTGDATVWKDIKFPMAPPKATGAGNPTLITFNGNQRGYSFAVNDAHDFNPEEIDHDAKVGSTATWHVHFLNQSNDGTDRFVNWQIEYAVEPPTGALPAPTTINFEETIPAGTAVNTPFRTNIGTFVIPGIARLVYCRISRVASVGTAPSADPVLGATHFHYELDTVGSRGIVTK